MSLDTAFKMAVSSCKSYDETTSWRSEDNVINITNSATSAGDFYSNEQLDRNCNSNNNKNKEFCSVNTNSYSSEEKDIEFSKVSQIELLEKHQAEILSLANLNNCKNSSHISENPAQLADQSVNGNSMKLLEVPVNCETNVGNEVSKNMRPEIKTEIDKIKNDVIEKDKFQMITQQVTVQTVEVNQPLSNQSNGEEDDQSVVNEEEEIRDPEWTEERFRVDRRKLEQMLQAAEGSAMSGEAFFNKVMTDSGTEITWPSKLKIGAKSKKDPHIKVSGKQENVKKARDMVMRVLDTKCTRVTLKMDVSHTEHSHVIGKGGYNIKRVMEDTECHIHFPDSNRNGAAEKSNQVSIAGQPSGVESAMKKIRELLPIVITFDLSLSGSIPDPNSPPIQQIVQTYSVSVQFKQRAKAYCTTTCTIRGSKDNITGIVEGTLKLMQHLTGGQILRATSQLEVAQQQHSYMLGRNACNVKHIMQKTGAQISFPDPSSVPKRNTIFISGSVEQVVVARERLMGCLPLVLMFDMKQDESLSSSDESSMLSRLMESLDVFISVKLKPKQPSKSVIVKSIERNIYNMFEGRRQLLKLPSTGVKTPPPSSSPTPLNISAFSSIPVAPVIRLPQTQSPHIKPQYIGIIQSNGVALMNGSMSPLTPSATPTGSGVLRPNWPHSPLPSPSQSPFLSQQATVAAIHAQQQHNMLIQAHINVQQQQQMAALASTSQPSSVVNSPPHQVKPDNLSPDPLQVTQQFIQENLLRKVQQPNQSHPQLNQTNQSKFERGQTPIKGSSSVPDFTDQWAPNSESEDPSSFKYNSSDKQDFPGNLRGLQRQVLAVQMGRLSANSSFNKGSAPERPLTHAHSFSDSNVLPKEDYPLLHHRLSLTEGIDAKNLLQVSNFKRGPGSSRRSTPTGSDRNSPLSAAEYQALSPEIDLSKQSGMLVKSPSSSSSSCDLQAALRNLQGSSKRGPFLQTDRLQGMGRLDGSFRSEKPEPDPQAEYFQTDSPAPPPGFDNFPLSRHSPLSESSYEFLRQKAYEAMQKGPVASEIRTPTNVWFGQGFSRSMPSHEWNRADNKKFKNRLDTNYEREDSSVDENAESSSSPSNNHLTMSQRLSNSTRGGSAFLSWREKNSHSLSSHAKDMVGVLPKRRQHSTFDPQPGEYMNHSIPPPPHPNDDSTPPPPFNPSPEPSNQPLVNALSLLSNLGGRSNSIELHDLLNHLNLQKYSDVFVKQEVDLQTFLTLTDSDLMELGISAFGPRKKILLAIEELKKNRNLLYGKTLNAAPGRPNSLRPQPSENMGAFLQGQSDPPSMRMGPHISQPPSSRLLNGNRGMVSQSGRW